MNIFKRNKKKSINAEIQHLLREMEKVQPGTEEYVKLAANLETVCNAAKHSGSKINWEPIVASLITGGISIGSMILVLNYEKLGVIATKAFGLVPRGRV